MDGIQQMPGIAQKPQKSWRTFHAPLHISPYLGDVETQALSLAIETVGKAVETILRQLLDALYIEQGDNNEVLFADLIFPCHEQDLHRASENIDKPRREVPLDKGPKETARPQYKNSYHLEDVWEQDGKPMLLFRIVERFSWEITRGENKGQFAEDLQKLDVTEGLQAVIMSWMRPSVLGDVPTQLRAGVCQQAGQQLLSHIGLVDYGRQPNVSFPSLEERGAQERLEAWLLALLGLAKKVEPFEYVLARDLYPTRYAPDDPRGDRLVNVDEDWLAFIRSPFPDPLPLNFVKADDVVLYERRWQTEERREKTWKQKRKGRAVRYERKNRRRIYAAIPLFDGVAPASPLGKLATDPRLGWWKSHCEEFQPLGAWQGRRLNPRKNMLVIPLEYEPDGLHGRSGWFTRGLSGSDGRKVSWSLLAQKQKRVGERAAKPVWEIHFATSKEVVPILRPHVLGIHFTAYALFWRLVNATGAILEEGALLGNEVLDQALEEKARLEELQGQLRWVGDIDSARTIKLRTYESARSILKLAREKNANLAVEKIEWLDKRRGGSETNRVFSMWNYAGLAGLLSWLGLEDAEHEGEKNDNDSVLVIREVSDYILRYTCPQCGARRKAKQTKENADTWLEGNVLQCRKCGFKGEVSDEFKAELVASLGAARLRERLAS